MKALICEGEWQPRKSYSLLGEEEKERSARVGRQVWRNPALSLQIVEDPTLEADDVLIAVKACGICGSDIHCRQADNEGYLRFSGPLSLPCILGHEYTGEVREVGAAVSTLRPGDKVAAEGMLWCGLCEPCRRGTFNQCRILKMVGFTSPGAFSEYILTKERYCWNIESLGESFSQEEIYPTGALIEPIGCAYNGLFVTGGGFLPGARIAVYGVGPIGLMAVALSRLAGASRVIAFDLLPERLEMASRMGADTIINIKDLETSHTSSGEVLIDISDGQGIDVIVEAAGAAGKTMSDMLHAIGPNGKIIYLGRADSVAAIDFNCLVSGGNRLIGSRGHAGSSIFPSIIRLLADGKLNPGSIITERCAFDDILSAFEMASRTTQGKVMVLM